MTPEVIDDRTLLYRSAGHVWRNTLPETCPSLRDDSILIVDRFGSQFCHDDRFRTIERGSIIPSGYCRLGDFVPYTKVTTGKAR